MDPRLCKPQCLSPPSQHAPLVPFPLEPETLSKDDEEEVEFPLTPELRRFLATFSCEYAGPVTMFNLLSFHKGMFPQYQLYMAGFVAELDPKYDAQPRLLGSLVKDGEKGSEEKPWDMVGWIHYPGAASFGRMLDDEAYKNLDRKYKKGVVRDNPILLIVELELMPVFLVGSNVSSSLSNLIHLTLQLSQLLQPSPPDHSPFCYQSPSSILP